MVIVPNIEQEKSMKKNKSQMAVAVVTAVLIAGPVFAAGTENVFLSGKVLEGENVIATFATPILLGRTLPVKDQVTDRSGVLTGVALALTPKEVVGGNVIVLVSGDLTKRSESSVIGWGVTTPATAVEIPNTTTESFHNQVVLAQGQSQVIPFGNCKLAEGKPPSCSHKLVLNARSQ